MSNSHPSPSVPVSRSEAATPSASAASPELSVQDLVTSDDDPALGVWDDRTLAVAAHFGYDGDGVPKQWLCATAQDAEPDGACCMYPLLELHAPKWVGLSLGHIRICSYTEK